MLVVAPGRFSTTYCWPRYSESFGVSRRAMMSVPPPGGKPTSTRTGRVGYDCPRTAVAASRRANPARIRFTKGMVSMEAVEIETGSPPQAAILWLHGLGADGHDFEPIVPELRLAKPVRFVFPHAPVQPVTINNGMRMRAWYDIFQFGGGREDDKGIRASQKLIEKLIEEQPVPPEKIIL